MHSKFYYGLIYHLPSLFEIYARDWSKSITCGHLSTLLTITLKSVRCSKSLRAKHQKFIRKWINLTSLSKYG